MTESEVVALLNKLETLYSAGDIDGMLDHYSDNATIVATIKTPTTMTMNFSKPEYKALIKSVIDNADSYTHSIENLNINLGKDVDSTFASYSAVEQFEMKGETLDSSSFVQVSFTANKDGKLLISSATVSEI